ncbi:MAG: sodium/glutamate symporter [bacterium]
METALLWACGLLLVGLVLRVNLKVLQVLYIPAAIIGGIVGLAASPSLLDIMPTGVIAELKTWPGWLIALIFAGLLLVRSGKSIRDSLREAAREGIVVWIIVVGEITLGLLATWLLLKHFYTLPYSFGQLIEAGFAGGHGTAAAMGSLYQSLGFEEGADLGFFVATVGLIYGVVSGIVLVNLAVRKGWTRAGTVEIPRITGLESSEKPEPIAFGKIRPEVLEPMVLQMLILSGSFGLGLGLQKTLVALLPFTERFPLFIFTLLAGLLVRELMRLLRIEHLIDPGSIRRITGVAIEFLIVAAIASLDLQAVFALFAPVAVLLLLAFFWTGFCLLFIGRRLLPKAYWFELGILNYGMSTGTTATGLMLLRIIDKDLESGAAEDYALAAPLSAPFIGGGILTFSLPFLVGKLGIAPVTFGLLAIICLLYFIGVKLATSD